MCGLLPRDLSLGAAVDGEGREAKRGLLRVGRGSGLLAGLRGRGAAAAQVAGLSPEFALRPARGVTSRWGSAGLYSWRRGWHPEGSPLSLSWRVLSLPSPVDSLPAFFCLPRPLIFPLEGDAAV